jgi:hypothetical protein
MRRVPGDGCRRAKLRVHIAEIIYSVQQPTPGTARSQPAARLASLERRRIKPAATENCRLSAPWYETSNLTSETQHPKKSRITMIRLFQPYLGCLSSG